MTILNLSDIIKPISSCLKDPVHILAIISLYVMAFFSPISIALGQIAIGIMVIVTGFYIYKNWSRLKSFYLLWITLAYIVYIVARCIVAVIFEAPNISVPNWPSAMDAENLVNAQWEGLIRWVRAGPVAILLAGMTLAYTGCWRYHSKRLLIAMLLGFCVMFFQNFHAELFCESLMGGSRYTKINLSIDGIKLVTIILGLFAFLPYFLRNNNFLGTSLIKMLIWFVLLSLAILSLLALQTRHVWLGGVTGMMIMGLCALYYTKKRKSLFSNYGTKLIIIFGLFLLIGVITCAWQPIAKRWGSSGNSIAHVLSTPFSKWNVSNLPNDSVGGRAMLLNAGLDIYSKKPIFGYGPADPRYLLEIFPEITSELIKAHGQYHNSHIELLMMYGFIGYFLIFIFALYCLYITLRIIRSDDFNLMLGLFVISFISVVFVYSLAEVHLERFKMVYAYALILGIPVASKLNEFKKK